MTRAALIAQAAAAPAHSPERTALITALARAEGISRHTARRYVYHYARTGELLCPRARRSGPRPASSARWQPLQRPLTDAEAVTMGHIAADIAQALVAGYSPEAAVHHAIDMPMWAERRYDHATD